MSQDERLERRRRTIELALVLGATAVPMTLSSLATLLGPPRTAPGRTAIEPLGEALEWLHQASFMAGWICVFALAVRLAHQPLLTFGLRKRPRLLDLVLAAALYLAYYGVWLWIPRLLHSAFDITGWPVPESEVGTHATLPGKLAFGLAMAVNGFAEELVVRCYLVPRLESLGVSTVAAVFASALLFGAYHLRYGPAAAICITVFGVLLGFVFAWRRSLWPVALAHVAVDLWLG